MNDHIFMVIKVIKSFLYSSSMYSYHLFLISSASVISLPFLSFIMPILAWHFPLIFSIFLKRSLVFPILLCPLFLCIVHLRGLSYLSLLFFGTLHSNGYIFPFLLCFSFPFFSQLFVRPPLTAKLLFCISFFNMYNVFIHKILFSSQLVSLGNVPMSQIPWVHHIIMLFFPLCVSKKDFRIYWVQHWRGETQGCKGRNKLRNTKGKSRLTMCQGGNG